MDAPEDSANDVARQSRWLIRHHAWLVEATPVVLFTDHSFTPDHERGRRATFDTTSPSSATKEERR